MGHTGQPLVINMSYMGHVWVMHGSFGSTMCHVGHMAMGHLGHIKRTLAIADRNPTLEWIHCWAWSDHFIGSLQNQDTRDVNTD